MATLNDLEGGLSLRQIEGLFSYIKDEQLREEGLALTRQAIRLVLKDDGWTELVDAVHTFDGPTLAAEGRIVSLLTLNDTTFGSQSDRRRWMRDGAYNGPIPSGSHLETKIVRDGQWYFYRGTRSGIIG